MAGENLIQFVLDAQKGNEDAFAKIYSQTLKNSYYLCLKLTADVSAAETLLRESYASAFINIGKLKKPESFEVWLKKEIATLYRDGQSFVFGDADGGAKTTTSEFLPQSVLEDEALCRKIEELVNYLPLEQRTATVLYYCVGMPVEYIGKLLNVSTSTVDALLEKARAQISSSVPQTDEPLSEGSKPVLSKIFQNSALNVAISGELVRKTFIYAIKEYENAGVEEYENAGVESAPPAPAAPAPEPAPAPVSEPVPQPEEPEKGFVVSSDDDDEEDEGVDIPSFTGTDTQGSKESNAVFLDGLRRGLDAIKIGLDDGTDRPAASPSFVVESPAVDEPEVTSFDVPSFKSTTQPEITEDEDDDADTDDGEKPGLASKFGKVKDSLSPKTKLYVLIAAALVVIIAVIIGIAVSKSKSGNDTPEEPSTSASDEAIPSEFRRISFLDDYGSIEYYNEYCCLIKDAETGKYGLMDYQGNVKMEPLYYAFKRCSYGRDYSNRNDYHYLVQLEAGGDLFEVDMRSFNIGTGVHVPHSVVDTDRLDDKRFSERDRYHNGYAAVCDVKTGKWGYVSEDSGKLVVDCIYEAVNDDVPSSEYAMVDYCLAFENNMVAVKRGGKMGVIDNTGKIIVNFLYDELLQGDRGVYLAKKDGSWGVLLIGDAVKTFTIEEPENSSAALDEILQYATELTAVYEVDAEDGANIRSAANTDEDNVIGELDFGTKVNVVAKTYDDEGKAWLCIEFEDGYGWVRTKYVTEVESETAEEQESEYEEQY